MIVGRERGEETEKRSGGWAFCKSIFAWKGTFRDEGFAQSESDRFIDGEYADGDAANWGSTGKTRSDPEEMVSPHMPARVEEADQFRS